MDHKEFDALLRTRVKERLGTTGGARLPAMSQIHVEGDLRRAKLTLTPRGILANMQTDQAAFDGWALVLMVWCGVERVSIDWPDPEGVLADAEACHFQRFLYRTTRFSDLIGDRIEVVRPERFKSLRLTNRATFNIAGPRTHSLGSASEGTEAALEMSLSIPGSPTREQLMRRLNLIKLDRQFPVGVFDGPPARGNRIFTGGKSAIDLIGLTAENKLCLMELKLASNVGVGSISELFFYAMLLHDAQQGVIRFPPKPAASGVLVSHQDIVASRGIRALLLSDRAHPLLGSRVFGLLNAAATESGCTAQFEWHPVTAVA